MPLQLDSSHIALCISVAVARLRGRKSPSPQYHNASITALPTTSKYKPVNADSIRLSSGLKLSIEFLECSILATNQRLHDLQRETSALSIDAFEVIDFRMLSGLMGEMLITKIDETSSDLEKNPNIDGYPDLLDISQKSFADDVRLWRHDDNTRFIKYPHGGIEVKNTFGTKKTGSDLLPGRTRIRKINGKPDWKAHHGYTNNLLAIFSDYLDGCPQIVAAMYADDLTEADWTAKQNPKAGSTMTSFTVIKRSGWDKLRAGLRLCVDKTEYLDFFGAN